MSELGGDPGVFVRSMATRGALGGLARGTLDAVDVLDAAGFDMVIIETVGVGQDEVEVARAAHTTVVVSAPGLGDDIQAIKAGILEIADIHVGQQMRPAATPTARSPISRHMLALGTSRRRPRQRPAWQPPVHRRPARFADEGIDELLRRRSTRHRAALERQRRDRPRAALRSPSAACCNAGEAILREHFARHRDGRLARVARAAARARDVDPYAAARELLARIAHRR